MKYLFIIASLFFSFSVDAEAIDPSVKKLWNEYQSTLSLLEKELVKPNPPSVWHFDDNQQDADALAALTLSRKKRATATSLWSFELIPTGRRFIETMPVVFEQFRVVWPKPRETTNGR